MEASNAPDEDGNQRSSEVIRILREVTISISEARGAMLREVTISISEALSRALS